MSTAEFIAALTASLAWPLTALTLGVMFRAPLTILLRNARRFKGFGIEFERDLDELQSKAATILPKPHSPQVQATPIVSARGEAVQAQAEAVANISPNAAVSLAWLGVEAALRSVVEDFLPDDASLLRAFAAKQIAVLATRGIIDQELADYLHKMRGMRNQAAHPTPSLPDVSAEDARQFAAIAASVIMYFDSLPRKSRPAA